MPKAKAKAKSRQKKNQQGKLHRFVQWASSHKLIVALLVAVIFGSVGVWKLTTSEAASTFSLSSEGCYLRGRSFNWYSGECTGCQSGAGSWVAPSGDVRYGYCSGAISRSIGTTTCANLKRDYVGIVGCARRWQQTNAANALQCANNSHTYRVTSTSDYCFNPTAPAPTTGWVWPVPATKSLGSLAWGESGSKGIHKGIDIGISGGGALGYKVVAAHGGKVERVWDSGACGYMMLIKAANTAYWQGYQHLSSGVQVRSGQIVQAGQHVGYIGRAGGSTCGSSGFYHLHFSVEKSNSMSYYASPLSNTINPCSVLPGC